MNQQLWDAVIAKDNWTFTETSLKNLVQDYLLNNDLPELLSLLCKIVVECNSNYYALYKTTIVMKYLCNQYREIFIPMLVDKSNLLENLKHYKHIDLYGNDQGRNVRNNAEQLLDFIGTQEKAGESVQAGMIFTMQNNLDVATYQLLETLNSISAVNSASILEQIRSAVIRMNRLLPGPITPEKYIGLDETPQINDIEYGRIVERFVDMFDKDWPIISNNFDSAIERFIVIDGASFPTFYETLITLADALKDSKNAIVLNSLVVLLEKLIRSEIFFSSITDICKIVKKPAMEIAETETKWQSTLQIIVSLPDRIANKLCGKVADCFLPDKYAKIISLHIGRAIWFLCSIQRKIGLKPNINMLSMLISKAVIVLGAQRFQDLFDIMSEWCLENPENIRDFINEILRYLDRAAIQPIAVTFLRRTKQSTVVDNIFGDLLNEPNWKHVFTVKIPLMSYYKDENLQRNLIKYLSTSSDEKLALRNLFIRLLDIWGDRSAMNHTSLEQHEYITELIVMSMREVKETLNQEEKNTARRLLFSGTSVHLESTQIELRAIGMITGEIVVEKLRNSEDEPTLKYDYDGMPEDIRILVERLRSLSTIEKQHEKPSKEETCISTEHLIFDNVGHRKLYELAVNCGLIVNTSCEAPVNDEVLLHAKLPEVITERKPTDQTQKDDDDDDDDGDLDSDDDLVPYDMSNDTPASEKLRPIYLRDLMENLINTQSNTDPNIFEESMKSAEELLLSQLPNDDPSFAIEFLEIFISLREITCVENFELLKFKSCVAITVVYPKESVKYMCNEFHKKIGQYSISDRLFILDIIAESARRLSKIEIKRTVVNTQQPKSPRKRHVSKPVSLAIVTDNGKKYETLYDDDFEVTPSSNIGSTDWEEIVRKRIESNTRIFAHPSKIPVTTINKFNDVASSFFYPLLYGFRRKETCMYNTPAGFEDQENILLVSYLRTLSTIMVAAENCVIVPKMAKEILDLAWVLRYHSQAKVRLCIIENLASVAITLPKEGLTTELMELIFELRSWLSDVSDDGLRGDPDSSCRALGKKVVVLIDSIFHSTLQEY